MTVPGYSAVGLLAALALLFISMPFVQDLPQGELVEAGLLTLVMVFAVRVLGGRRRILIAALLLVIPALAAKWVNHLRPDLLSPVYHLAFSVVFFAFVVAQLIRFILRAPRVDANVLCAGLSGYLLLGLLWTPAYLIVARLNPSAFVLSAGSDANATMDAFHAFYFSLITITTVGYGDICPVSKGARMLAAVEAIVGLFYMAVLISRLVAVYSSPQPVAEPDAKNPA
jgi:voltage-gated potassium channel